LNLAAYISTFLQDLRKIGNVPVRTESIQEVTGTREILKADDLSVSDIWKKNDYRLDEKENIIVK